MSIQYFVPGDGDVSAMGMRQYFIPGYGDFDDATSGSSPPGQPPKTGNTIMRHGKYFASEEEQYFYWAR